MSGDFSLWFLLLCALLAALYAGILYYRNPYIAFSQNTRRIMAVCRFTAVFIIAALFLSPLFKMNFKYKEKPLIILGLDNSESIVLNKDSAFYRTQFLEDYRTLVKRLSRDYDVRTYTLGFSSRLNDSVTFKEKTTDLADFFKQIKTLYAHRNLGAIVWATDGLYNHGNHPFYEAEAIQAPVYGILLGDTASQRDALIAGIEHNKTAFYGNFFPVQIAVKADLCQGEKLELTVLHNETPVFSKTLHINSKHYFTLEQLNLEAAQKGLQKYTVKISHLDNELTHQNNVRHFFIDVLDERQKIAIVFHAPHPDIAAIRGALEESDRYQVEVFSADRFNTDPSKYQVLIWHQLPSATHPLSSALAQAQKEGVSQLFIMGEKTNIAAFNQLQTGLQLQVRPNLTNDAFPVFNQNFTLFTFSEAAQRVLPAFTPLKTLFADYKISGGSHVFLHQKISGLTTSYPLIVFNQTLDSKNGVIMGEGIWRWRLMNFLEKENQDAFNELVNKMILYLAAKTDNSKFRLNHKSLYAENTPVIFEAEIFNEAHERITEPDIRLKLTDREGKNFDYTFSKSGAYYALDMGLMPVGDYSFHATTFSGGKDYSKSGHFSVAETAVESENLIADVELLQQISHVSHGKMFSPKQLDDLEKTIRSNEQIKTISYIRNEYKELLSQWWVFLLIIGFLTVEWGMRKWNGNY